MSLYESHQNTKTSENGSLNKAISPSEIRVLNPYLDGPSSSDSESDSPARSKSSSNSSKDSISKHDDSSKSTHSDVSENTEYGNDDKDKKKKKQTNKKDNDNDQNSDNSSSPKNKLRKINKIEKDCNRLRSEIDLKNYQNHLIYVDRELKLKRKRDLLRLEDEVEYYETHKKHKQLSYQVDMLNMKMELKEKQLKWREWADKEPQYLRNPLKKGPNGENELVLSDRIINLSGVITYCTSEYITDRIHYYNNQNDKHPIFIVIDYSPGGSVMSGYRILKTIESSPAPVYVIVKSFAASMAATIATLAPHSFVYPNAILLHHQIWSRASGNLVQQKEQVRDLEAWWKRLAEPVIKKLKINSLEEWIELMYQYNSDGDWSLFGDEAVKNRWADAVVHRIRKTGNLKSPDSISNLNYKFCQEEKKKETMENFLPGLKPMDYYWIYNPTGYYKIEGSIDKN